MVNCFSSLKTAFLNCCREAFASCSVAAYILESILNRVSPRGMISPVSRRGWTSITRPEISGEMETALRVFISPYPVKMTLTSSVLTMVPSTCKTCSVRLASAGGFFKAESLFMTSTPNSRTIRQIIIRMRICFARTGVFFDG